MGGMKRELNGKRTRKSIDDGIREHCRGRLDRRGFEGTEGREGSETIEEEDVGSRRWGGFV
jgi:hypothetical protein